MLPDEYGCVVTNRFGNLLDDDTDPFDLICAVETEKERKKKKKEQENKGKQKKPGQRESQRDRRVPITAHGPGPVHTQHAGLVTESRDSRQEGPRAMKRAAYGNQTANQEGQPREFSVPQPSYNADSDFRGRGRRGGRGFGGYMRNMDNCHLRGKREFDRHNGTGISPDEKRGGRGAWNWGSAAEATSEFLEVTSDTQVKSEEPHTQVEEENVNQAPEEDDGEMVVQVAMGMTLDEWKALQEMSRPKVELNIRKTESTIPSKATIIHQSKHLENLKEAVEDMEEDGNYLRRPVNDITSLVDIHFPCRPNRGVRGRARGSPVSRQERAEPRMERDDMAPNPDDPEAFPALSAGI